MANNSRIDLAGLRVFKEEVDIVLEKKANLDTNGKVPASQLPGYVDDVVEGYTGSPIIVQFDTSTFYEAGTIVGYQNKIYRFVVDHTAGDWDTLQVEEVIPFPATGETGKIYSDIISNKTYRWSGSTYTQIKGDIVIGTSPGTAFDGAQGATMQTKLDGIQSGAQVNTIETVKVNGTAVTPDGNKSIDITVPDDLGVATETEIRALFS